MQSQPKRSFRTTHEDDDYRSELRYQRLRVDAGASDSPASSLGPNTAEKIRNSCKFGPALVVPNRGARSIRVWRVGLKAKLGPSSISSTGLPPYPCLCDYDIAFRARV
jgi:hypothetical protein